MKFSVKTHNWEGVVRFFVQNSISSVSIPGLLVLPEQTPHTSTTKPSSSDDKSVLSLGTSDHSDDAACLGIRPRKADTSRSFGTSVRIGPLTEPKVSLGENLKTMAYTMTKVYPNYADITRARD